MALMCAYLIMAGRRSWDRIPTHLKVAVAKELINLDCAFLVPEELQEKVREGK